jgi:hypothetical protein
MSLVIVYEEPLPVIAAVPEEEPLSVIEPSTPDP